MLLKAAGFVLLLQIVAIYGDEQKFMIKNKKSGLVLDAKQNPVEIRRWEKKDSQLWTLKWSGTNGHYFVHNVGMGRVLDASPSNKDVVTWGKHGGPNQLWSLLPNEDDTRFQVQYYPDHFMGHKDGKVQVYDSRQSDGSDEWLLIVVSQRTKDS